MDQLKRRYSHLYPDEGTDGSLLEEIEKALGIRFPVTFMKTSSFYSGGLLGGISHFSIQDDREPNIKGETLRLRPPLPICRAG